MKILVTLSLLFCFIQLYAQSINPQVISASATPANQQGIKVNYTVGELMVKSIGNGNLSIGQGYNSSIKAIDEITIVKEADKNIIDVNVFPNPLNNLLTVSYTNSKVDNITIQVFNAEGKLVWNEIYTTSINNQLNLNTTGWSKGNYILNINSNNIQLASYKLVKP